MPDLPFALWIALAAMLGLLVGSFLNVVILRLPERMAAGYEAVYEAVAAEPVRIRRRTRAAARDSGVASPSGG